MKKVVKYLKIVFLLVGAILTSCVDDEGIFPDENISDTNISIALVTWLHALDDTISNEDDLCFGFKYPIQLSYNNNSVIRVDSFEGLQSVIASESSNFNINGIQFPIEIIFNDRDDFLSITDESELITVLNRCEVPTIRDTFDQFFGQCFTFAYPITLINELGEQTTLNSQVEFERFYNQQSEIYQIQFVFPITIQGVITDEAIPVNSYFDFYQIIDDCESSCNPIQIVTAIFDPVSLSYVFDVDLNGIDQVNGYQWLVEDEIVDSGTTNTSDIPQFQFNFPEPGIYLVCFKIDTDDCVLNEEVCLEVEVPSYCPNLSFEIEQEAGTLGYRFTANFRDIERVSYNWVIDGQIVGSGGGPDSFNVYLQQFEQIGDHEVCIKSTVTSCNEVIEYCEQITVNGCPDLFFEVQQDVEPVYTFMAEFPGIESVRYEWLINDDVIEQDGGIEADNKLFFQFDTGLYEVCIRAVETPQCPQPNSFCRQIQID